MVLISAAYVTLVWYQQTLPREEGQQVHTCHPCPFRRPLGLHWPCTRLSLCSHRLCGPDLPRCSEHRPPRVLLAPRNTSSHDAHLWLPPRNSGVHAGSRVPALPAHLQHSCHELHSRGSGAGNTQTPASPQGHLQPGYSPADHWYGFLMMCDSLFHCNSAFSRKFREETVISTPRTISLLEASHLKVVSLLKQWLKAVFFFPFFLAVDRRDRIRNVHTKVTECMTCLEYNRIDAWLTLCWLCHFDSRQLASEVRWLQRQKRLGLGAGLRPRGARGWYVALHSRKEDKWGLASQLATPDSPTPSFLSRLRLIRNAISRLSTC